MLLQKIQFSSAFALLSVFLFAHNSFALQEINFTKGMELGRGLNLLSGDLRGSCVSRTTASAFQGGQNTRLSIDRIESKEQLRQFMGLDAQASLRGIGSAKAEYFKSREINQYSLFLLVKAIVQNSQKLMDMEKVAIKDNAKEILKAGKVARFRERCGDVFINGIVTGGEFFAIYEMTTSSEKDQESLEVALKGSYGIFSGSAEFKKSLDKVSEFSTTNIFVHREGDIGTAIPKETDAILNYAVNFPSVIAKSKKAVTYKVLTLDYKTLDLPGDTENLLKTRLFEDEIQFLARKDNGFDDAMQSITYVLDHPKQFINLTSSKKQTLNTKLSELRDGQRAVQRKASACFDRQEESCFKPFEPTLPDAGIGSLLPKRREVSEPTKNLANQKCDTASVLSSAIIDLQLQDDKSIQILYKRKDQNKDKLHFFESNLTEKDTMFWTTLTSKVWATRKSINNHCTIMIDKEIFRGQNCFRLESRKGNDASTKCINVPGNAASVPRAVIKKRKKINNSISRPPASQSPKPRNATDHRK